jgi:Eco29kI restriction endonuclease
MSTNFDPKLHTFHSPKFKSVVEDAVNFFQSTPAHTLPPPSRFAGAGVYALYYDGDFELYERISEQNKGAAVQPIYVGKAVPPGSRTGMNVRARETADLFSRLREHTRSLQQAENLKVDDFRCRFMVLNGDERDLIAPVESALIRKYRPLWNANVLSGFGIHTPGKGRFEQARSRWDILHPGRSFASHMANLAASDSDIIADVRRFLEESASS